MYSRKSAYTIHSTDKNGLENTIMITSNLLRTALWTWTYRFQYPGGTLAHQAAANEDLTRYPGDSPYTFIFQDFVHFRCRFLMTVPTLKNKMVQSIHNDTDCNRPHNISKGIGYRWWASHIKSNISSTQMTRGHSPVVSWYATACDPFLRNSFSSPPTRLLTTHLRNRYNPWEDNNICDDVDYAI
jgi:hypothetical protein